MFEKYSFWMTENLDNNRILCVSIEIFQEDAEEIEGGKSLKIIRVYSKEEAYDVLQDFKHLFTRSERNEILSDILDLSIVEKKYPIGRDHDHNVDRTHKTK